MQHNLWTAKPLLRFGLLANDVATAVIIATSTTWRNKPKRRRVAALQSQARLTKANPLKPTLRVIGVSLNRAFFIFNC